MGDIERGEALVEVFLFGQKGKFLFLIIMRLSTVLLLNF